MCLLVCVVRERLCGRTRTLPSPLRTTNTQPRSCAKIGGIMPHHNMIFQHLLLSTYGLLFSLEVFFLSWWAEKHTNASLISDSVCCATTRFLLLLLLFSTIYIIFFLAILNRIWLCLRCRIDGCKANCNRKRAHTHLFNHSYTSVNLDGFLCMCVYFFCLHFRPQITHISNIMLFMNMQKS